MLKLYTKAKRKQIQTHPNTKWIKIFNEYEAMCFQLFCNNYNEFKERFGKNLFDDGIDCKAFLEDYFNIKL